MFQVKGWTLYSGFQSRGLPPCDTCGFGIESWEDLKGKTVFTGPPEGSASATSEALIEIITGYEAGTDYTAVRLSWGEGYAALSDTKIDMMVRPAEIGSSKIEQFGLSGEFRVLSIPQEVVGAEAMQSLFGRPGRGMLQFDGGVYKGQLTGGEITALGFEVLYLLYGQDFPGILAHAGFSLKEVAEALWYNTNKGVFGSITNIVLSTVFIFIVFGVLLEGTGAGDTLLKFAFPATRRTRGGPAHAAILASSLFGAMSGSTVANIVGTGTFTIPMIKKRGFSPTFAAGTRRRRPRAGRSCRRSWGLPRCWSRWRGP